MQNSHKLLFFTLICLSFFSCNKYLDEKALKQQFIPSSIEDLQALLDNPLVYKSDPPLLEMFSDEYYVTSKYWEGLTPDLSLNYIWAENAVPHNNSWNIVYQQPVYLSNIVLDNLESSNISKGSEYDYLKGAALFHRANAFYNLAQLFALPYTEANKFQPGIVLRMTSDINKESFRSNIFETYDKILQDLKEAFELLPLTAKIPTRPSKLAVLAALARVYLSMSDFENALNYSNQCLQQHSNLLDYNELVPGDPIKSLNSETIFHSQAFSLIILSASNAKIDSFLFDTYDENDLRKSIFFRPNSGQNIGTYAFRGSYNGTENTGSVFTGTTTAEMLLIRSECNARRGKTQEAVDDLNKLLAKRWKKEYWMPINADNINIDRVLELVLAERRKELVYRGIRWGDLRRLNMTGANITIKRMINGTLYTLPPNDKRGLALIPYEVITRSGIQQNDR